MKRRPAVRWAAVCGIVGVVLAHEAVAWRSALYPEEWTPAFTDGEGRFLHDFSYAGYRNGAAAIPVDHVGPVFDVVSDFGADNTGASDATGAIQAAIDEASDGGGVVYLPGGLYRCDGVLQVAASRVVIRGDGPGATFLYFTRHEGMSGRAHLTFQGSMAVSAPLLLAADGENRSRTVQVADASGLNVGDEVGVGWTITDAFVAEHGMTGTWYSFNGQWKPVFRREVTGLNLDITPHTVTIDVPLRYAAKTRDGAALRRESGYLEECGIEDLALANAVASADAWAQVRQHLVAFREVKDCWARSVHSFPSPLPEAAGYHVQNCGFYIWASKRVTIADCDLRKAQNRGSGGCGYLYEIGASNEVLVRDSIARDGRHNYIQNWDFGTTGCVFLRCQSSGSRSMLSPTVGFTAYCEYHHSLAMACLVDACTLDDGWYGGNRRGESSGAGHTVTESAYWNTIGGGTLRSYQYGQGYIIGTGPEIELRTSLGTIEATGTAPEDYIEGAGEAGALEPASLYLDQLGRRLGADQIGNLDCGRPRGGLYSVGDDLCLVVPSPVSLVSTFQWRKNGAALPNDARITGRNARKLVIVDLDIADSGVYTCQYENGSKQSATFTAYVTVAASVPSLAPPWFPSAARPGAGADSSAAIQ
ncbi:MAG TPA: glycosyl hydrolase family 28-related protein [Candidatus Hydrogenedentes bacterium]|nr:glycosyl hydrolase family 28-related protein [Candidatus Hydrogenedentota bacterium]